MTERTGYLLRIERSLDAPAEAVFRSRISGNRTPGA
jgi:hypothetical protein